MFEYHDGVNFKGWFDNETLTFEGYVYAKHSVDEFWFNI